MEIKKGYFFRLFNDEQEDSIEKFLITKYDDSSYFYRICDLMDINEEIVDAMVWAHDQKGKGTILVFSAKFYDRVIFFAVLGDSVDSIYADIKRDFKIFEIHNV